MLQAPPYFQTFLRHCLPPNVMSLGLKFPLEFRQMKTKCGARIGGGGGRIKNLKKRQIISKIFFFLITSDDIC